MPLADSPPPLRLEHPDVSPQDLRAVTRGAAYVETPWKVLRVTGPGAITCLQGLLTNDIEQPGDATVTYGALLTNRGMILTDLWALRSRDSVDVLVPPTGLQVAKDVFTRSIPPRLATLSAPELAVHVLVGPLAGIRAHEGGHPLPEPGHIVETDMPSGRVTVARPPAGAYFALLVVAETGAGGAASAAFLQQHVAGAASASALDAARVLAGWPALGLEIDGKTLPQEVRFDEIGGVSYSKGCYVGQETVARVHYRGHPNRRLHGLVFTSVPDEATPRVARGGRECGRVTALLELPDRTGWVGLGILRRELVPGDAVTAAGVDAHVTSLPHAISTGA